MLKARCKRYANRTMVVGKTAFVFDKDGICSVADVSNTRVDYEQLLTMNQVTAVTDDEPLVPDPPSQIVTKPDPPGEVTTTAPETPAPEPAPTPSQDVVTSVPEPQPVSEDSSRKKKKSRRPVKKD